MKLLKRHFSKTFHDHLHSHKRWCDMLVHGRVYCGYFTFEWKVKCHCQMLNAVQ